MSNRKLRGGGAGHRLAALTMVASLLLAASACASEEASAEQRSVTIRGPFVTAGTDAPWYYADELGYYADAGIDVTIRDSKGSTATIADVGNGGSDFGIVNSTNVMLAVSLGQDVVSVATVLGKSSYGFFVPEESDIDAIQGLQGRSIAATALVSPNLDAALAAGGLTNADVEPVFADASALISTYLDGKVDSLYTTAIFAAATTPRPSKILLQADAGFNPPDYSLIVNRQLLEDDPELVRDFTRATLRGFQAAKDDPEAAIDAIVARHPELEPVQALSLLAGMGDFHCSEAQRGQPYGFHAESDWTTAAVALQTYGAELKGEPAGSRFFTNSLFEGDNGIDAESVGAC